MDAHTILDALWVYAAAFGATVMGLSAWLGKAVAERTARKETAAIQRETAAFQDALVRRRDVYCDIACTMRVFLTGSHPSTPDDKRAFLRAYDIAYLWASRDVVSSLNAFLEQVVIPDGGELSSTQEERKRAYAAALSAMRMDSGHEEAPVDYRVVQF